MSAGEKSILEQIVEEKRREVTERKSLHPVGLLEQSFYFETPTVSLKKYVQRKDQHGIIAEFKRRSPSKGVINAYASPERTTIGYIQAGASALSVLTDQRFFGGSNEDLTIARKFNACPVLRKDFVIDEYQVIEAKSIGADAILLIAAVLDPKECKSFAALAHSLGLEVLLEVHDEFEWRANVGSGADIVGVNNRNLKTFEVTTETSKALAAVLPSDVIKISESGIREPHDIADLRQYGFDGFLIGENFMEHRQPELKAREFISELERISPRMQSQSSVS